MTIGQARCWRTATSGKSSGLRRTLLFWQANLAVDMVHSGIKDQSRLSVFGRKTKKQRWGRQLPPQKYRDWVAAMKAARANSGPDISAHTQADV